MKQRKAAIGFRSKTGRAIAVALSGSASAPEFILREELALWDKNKPVTIQPYHQVMELPWSEAIAAMKPRIEVIEKIAIGAVAAFIERVESHGYRVAAIGVVGPADRKLERIGSQHIRAHAAEGVLYRKVLEVAAKANRRPFSSFVKPDEEIGKPAGEIKKVLTALGKIAGSPWRLDEKAAAVAAWAVLSRPSP
jgi:hypothetical protein